MRHLLVIIFALGLCSCSQQKQAAKKVNWLLARDLMDDECARLYPNVDSIVKGDTVTNFDTLYVENEVYIRDTVTKDGKIVYIEKKCPPHQTVTKTVFVKPDTIFRDNGKEKARLTSIIQQKDRQIKDKDDQVTKMQKNLDKDDWWKIACLITWFAIVLGGVFRFFVIKKPI
jgi:hypothetical protein